MSKSTLVYFGSQDFSALTLTRIIEAGYPILAVVSTPNQPVAVTAKRHHIPLLTPMALKDQTIVDNLTGFKPDFLVVFSYGKIIPQQILEIPKYAPINIHPSLLPKYRGPSPMPAQILAGENETGVTIIKMTNEVDAGPIYAMQSIPMPAHATYQSLSFDLAELGSKMLIDLLPNIVLGEVTVTEQNHSKATYTKLITKRDGFMTLDDLSTIDLTDFDRRIRAYFPWPTVWTKLGHKTLKFLPDHMVQLEGKSPVTIKAFLNGYPQARTILARFA